MAGWRASAGRGSRSSTKTRRTRASDRHGARRGAGKRLGAGHGDLPKTLLPVDGDRTILDVALGNLAAVGLEEAVVVTGFAADRIEERADEARRSAHGCELELVFNPKAEEWNNAYSLWCAREHFAEGVLLVNGDTVHPASVEERLLAARGSTDLVIAVDDVKPLGEEEMKVHLTAEGLLDRINKSLDPATAQGEYIGVTLIEPRRGRGARRRARGDLASATRSSTTRTASRSSPTAAGASASRRSATVEWVEVDDHADLARAREVACRC